MPRLPESQFVFEDYLAYTEQLAARWDEHASLDSISRQTRCDGYEQVAGQTVLTKFWRSTQYWFGQRIEWFEVIDRLEYSDIVIRIWTPGNSTQDKSPIDLASIAVGYPLSMLAVSLRQAAES